MQVSDSLEGIICFHLKYAIDIESVINTVNKKELGEFLGAPCQWPASVGCSDWSSSEEAGDEQDWAGRQGSAVLGDAGRPQTCSHNTARCWFSSQGYRSLPLHV